MSMFSKLKFTSRVNANYYNIILKSGYKFILKFLVQYTEAKENKLSVSTSPQMYTKYNDYSMWDSNKRGHEGTIWGKNTEVGSIIGQKQI